MDANVAYPLPVATDLVADSDSTPDRLAWLRQRLCKLAALLVLLQAICRRLRRELVELRQHANYWKAQHQRAVQREAVLTAQVDLLQGKFREWKRRFFGRKSETAAATTPTTNNNSSTKKRKRGQQPGSKGHGRRNHDHLTVPRRTRLCALRCRNARR